MCCCFSHHPFAKLFSNTAVLPHSSLSRAALAQGNDTVHASLSLIRDHLAELFKLLLRGAENRQTFLDYLAAVCNINTRRALLGSRTVSNHAVS